MRPRVLHHWRRYEGLFVLTFVAVYYGHGVAGITILNVAFEIEF